MFGLFKSKKVEVLSHWYSLVPDFNTSTKEFYEVVEQKLKDREVPSLEISREEFFEGGILSAKREYLRMRRERLVFDVCAAPFGTSYFFSCRFAEIPAVIRLWQVFTLLFVFGIAMAISFVGCGQYFGAHSLFIWPIAWGIFIASSILVMRNAVGMGLHNLDAAFVNSSIIGPLYERWFRRDTYYRQDTRLMYCDTVNALVKSLVEETTAAKGVKLVQFNEYNPVLGELYKPAIVLLKQPQPS